MSNGVISLISISASAEYGALVVYTAQRYKIGETTTVYALNSNGEEGQPYYVPVDERTADSGEIVFVAIFPRLPEGNYIVYDPGGTVIGGLKNITVFAGEVSEVKYP